MPPKHDRKSKPFTSRDLLGLTHDILKFLTTVLKLLNACGKAQGWW